MKTIDLGCDCCAIAPAAPAESEIPRVALVGAPNCGKTALFNALTGSRQKVANYAGVTVERKEGRLCAKNAVPIQIIDLPGTVSLTPRSPDEAITRDVLFGKRADEGHIDAILCVADATNLQPALRLLLELKQTGLPILVAVNMMDIARASGMRIDLEKLSRDIGLPVVGSVAVRRGGLGDLLKALCHEVAAAPKGQPHPNLWQEPDAAAIRRLSIEAEALWRGAVTEAGSPSAPTNKIDRLILHPGLGLIILLGLLFLMFQAIFAWAKPMMEGLDSLFGLLAASVQNNLPETLFRHFLTDGLIAGVGSVVVFLPQILLLFLFILLLEDSGYMARAAFLMDRLMGGAGLHGRAFIPLLSSFACAIPGILSARTIENPKDRLTTILIAPFMTCSARLPVYTLVIGAMIPDKTVGGLFGLQGLVMFSLYAAGIAGGLLVAFILKRGIFGGTLEPLLLSLPNYKRPSARNILWGLWLRGWTFLKRAGTIIFLIAVLVWVLSTFPLTDGAPAAIEQSYAGLLGHFIEPIMRPIGFSWQMTLSLIPAMTAREVAVATLGTIYAVGGNADEASASLVTVLQTHWSLPAALAYLAWFVFAPQCLSTLVVVRRETGRWLYPIAMFTSMTLIAYAAAWGVYRTALLMS